MKKTVKFAASGALAGIANGLFGAGGGMFLVPLFCRWCGIEERKAFATSVAVVAPLSAVSALVYLWRQDVEFVSALPFLLGGMVGGAFASRCLKSIPTNLLRRIFALFLLYGGVRSLFF
ncbi:MAG: sulfite exporter TauE/SafE family protein [Oscillospiraceae bacterium]|nr:sulfite exporter TauE/SafE family protein [Oscillospiraceae bacterium]